MSATITTIKIPFVSTVTMDEHWMRWLSRCSPADILADTTGRDGMLTWSYDRHGPLPWMQFFYDWRFGDLLGDGTIGMIQSSGARRQIAYTLDGSVLWDYNDPNAECSHIRFDSAFPVASIRPDLGPVFVCARRFGGTVHLCIVDAGTGETVEHVPFPSGGLPVTPGLGHDHCSLKLYRVSGTTDELDIVVTSNCRHVSVLSPYLEHRWSHAITEPFEREHTPLAHSTDGLDVDGDGRDEIISGSCLFDDDGSLLWVAPDLPALLADGHADSVRMVRLCDDSDPRVVMSTGATCLGLGGQVVWSDQSLRHGQKLHIGSFRRDDPCRQVVVYEAASRVVPGSPDSVVLYREDGTRLWSREVVQPDMQEGGFGFWVGDWTGDGRDEIFVNDGDACLVLDGENRVIETLRGHLIYVLDLVGDARVEAVMLDGIGPDMRVSIVANTERNGNSEANAVPEARATTPAMYNCSRY